MARQSFLVVSLKESKTKKLAQAITNDTSVKILDFLANRESATETEIAKSLKLAQSTVHYNLQALLETRMVKWDKFHYSEKGKEVRHYMLANRYILIASEREVGLRERLKEVLPITGILLAATLVIQYISSKMSGLRTMAPGLEEKALMTAASDAEARLLSEEGAAVAQTINAVAPSIGTALTQSIAFWFATGAAMALLLYLAIGWLRKSRA